MIKILLQQMIKDMEFEKLPFEWNSFNFKKVFEQRLKNFLGLSAVRC